MKRIIAICGAALLALAFTPESGAQNTSDEDYDSIKEFVDNLADINYRKEENHNNYLDAEDAVQGPEVSTVADVAELIPSFPTADQIINLDQSFNLALQEFSKSSFVLANVFSTIQANSAASTRRAGSAMGAGMGAGMGSMGAGMGSTMQIMALMKKHGIDPEKATEKEMEEFIMAAITSGEFQIAQGNAQAFDMNYSEEQEADIDAISDKVDKLVSEANDYVAEMQFFTSQSDFMKGLNALYNESVNSWIGSAAYKKIYDIEKDIDKRARDYFKDHPSYNDYDAEIPYPSFWVKGRQQENAIIREYNMSYLTKWMDKIQSALEKPIASLRELADVDAELDAAFSDKTDPSYTILKSQISTALTHLNSVITFIMGEYYSAPVIESVEESKVLYMQMG